MPWIDCQKIADRINHYTADLVRKFNMRPYGGVGLNVITNPSDASSESYLKSILAAAKVVNIEVLKCDKIEDCSPTKSTITLQPGLKTKISYRQDAEGNDSDDDLTHISCTARACVEIIKSVTEIEHKDVVIIGYGKNVGKPLSYLLMREHAGSVTTTHKYTEDLKHYTRIFGEIVISAVGKEKLVTQEMISPDTVIIDVGINTSDKGIVGDVDPAVAEKAFLTPVPGGVGPVTTALMLRNVVMFSLLAY